MAPLLVHHQPPLDRNSAMLYMPNTSAYPSVGNGAVWVATDEERKRRKLRRTYCVLDDAPSPLDLPMYCDLRPREETIKQRLASIEGHLEAAELLGMGDPDIYCCSWRHSSYEQIAHELLKAGIVKDLGGGNWVYADAPHEVNRNFGEMYPPTIGNEQTSHNYYVRTRYALTNIFIFICHVFLNNVPVHIDGEDIIRLWPWDNFQFERVAKLFPPRPPLQHEFIPVIMDNEHAALHKSGDIHPNHRLVNWCKLWNTPEERRARLLAMILQPGASWAFENIVRDTDVIVLDDGTHEHRPRSHCPRKGYIGSAYERRSYMVALGPFVYRDTEAVEGGLLLRNPFESSKPCLLSVAGSGTRKVLLHQMEQNTFVNGTRSEHLKVLYGDDHTPYNYWCVATCSIPLIPGSMIDIIATLKSKRPLGIKFSYGFQGIPCWSGIRGGQVYSGSGEWEQVSLSNVDTSIAPEMFPPGLSPWVNGYDGTQVPEIQMIVVDTLGYGDGKGEMEFWIDELKVVSRFPAMLTSALEDLEKLTAMELLKGNPQIAEIGEEFEQLTADLAAPYPETRLEAQKRAPEIIERFLDIRRDLALKGGSSAAT